MDSVPYGDGSLYSRTRKPTQWKYFMKKLKEYCKMPGFVWFKVSEDL